MSAEAALKKARAGLLRLLGYRQRSRREAADYLQRKGFDEPVIDAVLEEMERWNYLDDRRFAVDCIESGLRRGIGPHRVRHNLLAKGVSKEIVEEELTRLYSAEQELALARSLLHKRAAVKKDLTEERWVRRQAAYLQQRGFSAGIASRTIREHNPFRRSD